MEIGKRLRKLREAKGLSQGDIQERSGLARSFVSRFECGHEIPSLKTLERYALALEVPLYELFYGGGEQPEPPRPPDWVKGRLANGEDFSKRRLWRYVRDMNEANRKLLLALAQQMAKRGGNRGQQR